VPSIETWNSSFKKSSRSSKVVLDPLDVVFSKIITCLYLDEGDIYRTPICDTVAGSCGDVHGLPRAQGNLLAVNGRQGLSLKYIPMLGAATMALKTQALTGIDDNPFDLVIRGVGQNLIATPGAMISFHKDPFYFDKK
jgi:hypothetical protein